MLRGELGQLTQSIRALMEQKTALQAELGDASTQHARGHDHAEGRCTAENAGSMFADPPDKQHLFFAGKQLENGPCGLARASESGIYPESKALIYSMPLAWASMTSVANPHCPESPSRLRRAQNATTQTAKAARTP